MMKMIFKISSIIFLVFFVSQNSSLEIRGFVDKIVPTPIQCLFRNSEACQPVNAIQGTVPDPSEQGSLAFGRELVQGVKEKIEQAGEGLGISVLISNVTAGLDCNMTFSNGKIEDFKSKIKAIYPGTKWCGDGNVAGSFDDLGKFSGSDACCRDHDNCANTIAAGETKFGLVNPGLFTRSHCNCDKKFYECLKDTNSLVAKSIGVTYFTVLGPQCFKEDYPIASCLRQKMGRCEEYKTDTEKETVYQWFDNPTYL